MKEIMNSIYQTLNGDIIYKYYGRREQTKYNSSKNLNIAIEKEKDEYRE